MIFEILTGVFVVTTILGFYSSWNLMKKQEMTEDWMVALETRLSNIITEIKDIDDKGMFEADDEVGTIFTQINSMIKTLNDFLAK
jgi:hypothetical protein|tara:strand:+ start:444 stop:698 length:255 start_codon:yes stop_codon:yes gene_type:complete